MRRIRMLIVGIFVISLVIFGAYKVKTKQLEDHTPPVITCDENVIVVKASANDQELLKGVTAEDNKDGDLTDSIRISARSHFIEKGKRTITYIVFDEANQAGMAQRTVIYSDYESPKIYLSEPLRYSMNQNSNVNPAQFMTASDCLDGDLTKQIRLTLSDEYYSYVSGEKEITAQVTNSAGDVRVIPLQVMFVDQSDKDEGMKYYPCLTDYIVYTKIDKTLQLSSYLKGMQRGNMEYSFEEDSELLPMTKKEVKIEHEINYSREGVYPVEYSYTTEEGIRAVTKMYVVVEE